MRYHNEHTIYLNDYIGIGGLCGKLFGSCKPFK